MQSFPKVKRSYEDDDDIVDTIQETKLTTIELDMDDQMEENQNSKETFLCDAHGCSAKFSDLFSYEQHYNTMHRNACRFCKSVFPSRKLLDLHVLEIHDTMFKVLAQKRNMV